MSALLPGSVLGVLGGGQLGRMFTLVARRMGYDVVVFTPEGNSPAGQVATREVCADYDDLDAVRDFAGQVDVVTFEFENVLSATVEAASARVPVRPSGTLLHTTQDRIREKRALENLGLPVAPFAVVASAEDLPAARARTGLPAIMKTAAWGYDGRGQRRIEKESELEPAWHDLGSGPAVLEGLVPFQDEISVVGVRGIDGTVALYEPVLNHHSHHILDVTLSPAPLPDAVRREAREIARTVLEDLDVHGVLCVELFREADNTLRVNELAPRPHNSGHVTIDAHECSQFEQQVRAACGLPLGSTRQVAPAAAMANLLGDLWEGAAPRWDSALQDSGIHLHLYGKAEPRPGRKMGHLTVVDEDLATAEERARSARRRLRPA
jgi:5-(carboxyamino)imidazole ribonucleotide synthase